MRCEFRRDLDAYLAESMAKRKTLREVVEFYEANPGYMIYGMKYLRDALESEGVSGGDYVKAMAERDKLQRELLEGLSGYDACLMTGPTSVMHFAGLPSVAIRLAMGDDFTPRGMILYGADERRLLSAALTLEAYCGPVVPPVF
jgi:Asp-tRNA(Asn)/Glu-tRNA(Gln) amidotransferase A subunit family amidase